MQKNQYREPEATETIKLARERTMCDEGDENLRNTTTRQLDCPSCGVEFDASVNFCSNGGAELNTYQQGEQNKTDSHEYPGARASVRSDSSDEVPESLILRVEGYKFRANDGDTIGHEIRAALNEAGHPDTEALRIHREHVRFIRKSDHFYLLDLGDNPTRLNGQPLQKGDCEPVSPGDEIELSGVAVVVIQNP